MPSLPRVRYDGERCTNSSATVYAAGLGVLACCSVLVIAVPLSTAGYNWRVATNADLTLTNCTTVAHITEASTCHRECNCVQVPTGTQTCTTSTSSSGGTSRSCMPNYRRQCSSCPYTCYDAFWNVTYTATPSGARAEPVRRWELVHENLFGRHSHLGGAMVALRNGHPVGSTAECFYDVATLGDIVFSVYRPTPFLVFATAFYALGGVCVLCALLCCALALCEACERVAGDAPTGSATVFDKLPAGATARRRRRSSRSPKAAAYGGGLTLPMEYRVGGFAVPGSAAPTAAPAPLPAINSYARSGGIGDHSTTFDYGDAPESYSTLLSAGTSAVTRHSVLGEQPLRLGFLIDTEPDGQPTVAADGDGADDDGVSCLTPLAVGAPAIIEIVTTGTAPSTGNIAIVSLWIDYDQDGVFCPDCSSACSAECAIVESLITVPGIAARTFVVPAAARLGATYARARIAPAEPGGLVSATGTVLAGGEVEDYLLDVVVSPTATPTPAPTPDTFVFDFGDAPASYGTTLGANGARHVVAPAASSPLQLGATIDMEGDAVPSANAVSDGTDEDGVLLPSMLTKGTPVSVMYGVSGGVGSAGGYVSMWIDYDQDGTFCTDCASPACGDECVFNQVLSPMGVHTQAFTVPATAVSGSTYMRIRLSSSAAAVAQPVGFAPDGEVEDFWVGVWEQYDFGDAPGDFGQFCTILFVNGPRHVLDLGAANPLRLGARIDTEPDGLPLMPPALGDDSTGVDDEDGVLFTTAPLVAGAAASVQITVSGADAVVAGSRFVSLWIDYDGSESFCTDCSSACGAECVLNQVPVATGVQAFAFNVPADAVGQIAYARARLSSVAAGVASACGEALDGEVEDHAVPISAPTSSPSSSPTVSPTVRPSASPSVSPTVSPTLSPSPSPVATPTRSPSTSPVATPTRSPSASPSVSPSAEPTASPNTSPSASPSAEPTASPSTSPSASPSAEPTATPSTSPSAGPTASPNVAPSVSPTPRPSTSPSASPTTAPSASPTASPSQRPSISPSASPTTSPSASPTASPSRQPSASPTPVPSASPMVVVEPTLPPTSYPSGSPTTRPTGSPSTSPTVAPSTSPSTSPSASPTPSPTASPSTSPTASPTSSPSASPSVSPTARPTASPSTSPTASPTMRPSASPSVSPTARPTASPTRMPTDSPTVRPTASPTRMPTDSPTQRPTASPTPSPTVRPTASPTRLPTDSPTLRPTASPTPSPTLRPTASPTVRPTASPTPSPTVGAAICPTLLVPECVTAATPFTCDVLADFSALDPCVQIATDATNDVGKPASAPPGTMVGWEMADGRVRYVTATDTMYVGINTPGVAGDADGDGDPNSASAGWFLALGGEDFANNDETESIGARFDIDEDGVYDIIVGFSATAPFGPRWSEHSPGFFFIATPFAAFSSDIGAVHEGTATATSTSCKHFEISITSWSTIPLSSGSDGTDTFLATFFAGSFDDDGVGEDHIAGNTNPVQFCTPGLP